jgi:predicted phosphoribosyltransferase
MFERRFENREEAGKRLAKELLAYRGKATIVFAIPRGGVVTAYEIAKVLDAPLDIIIPRKIGAPGNQELAIGAVTEDGTTILNTRLVTMLGISDAYIESEKVKQIEEIKRRVKTYRGEHSPKDIEGKIVILVDDGIATGATVRAAIHSLRKGNPSFIIVAIPVGPPDTIQELKQEVDKLICLITYEPFFAIGQFYTDFSQVPDRDVITLLKKTKFE